MLNDAQDSQPWGVQSKADSDSDSDSDVSDDGDDYNYNYYDDFDDDFDDDDDDVHGGAPLFSPVLNLPTMNFATTTTMAQPETGDWETADELQEGFPQEDDDLAMNPNPQSHPDSSDPAQQDVTMADEEAHGVLAMPPISGTAEQWNQTQWNQTTPEQPELMHMYDEWAADTQGFNGSPTLLPSFNPGLVEFLWLWSHYGVSKPMARSRPPSMSGVMAIGKSKPSEVRYADLAGDECDFQGLDWTGMNTTRHAARTWRNRTYQNYTNCRPAARHVGITGTPLKSDHSFFRFRRMLIRQDVYLAHFQLRGLMASPSSTQTFYASPKGIMRMDMMSNKVYSAMDSRHFLSRPIVTALDASYGYLFGGTFNGEYCYRSLYSDPRDEAFESGQITTSTGGITNHVKLELPRTSSSPVAAIASNDDSFRILDLATKKLVSEHSYSFPINCTALSSDGRLRAVVGDDSDVLITRADTGEVLRSLRGHCDFGFACDWSDNGWTVATGFQDKSIKIWDARRWCDSNGQSAPVAEFQSKIAGVRNLRFSPAGSGRPVLVAVEEADYVNIIDAQTFSSRQTIDLFGELGGASFTNEGQNLNVLSCDGHRGGILQLERCGPVFDSLRSTRTTPRNDYSSYQKDLMERAEASYMNSKDQSSTMLRDLPPF